MLCFGYSFAIGLQVGMLAPITDPGAYIEQKPLPLPLKVDLQNLRELLLDTIILYLIIRFLCLTKLLTPCKFFYCLSKWKKWEHRVSVRALKI